MPLSKNIRLKAAIEKKELVLKERMLDAKMALAESCCSSYYGTPYQPNMVDSYGDPIYGQHQMFGRDMWQDKSTTVRHMQQLDFIRNRAKFLYERNCNARACVTGMRSFVIGSGLIEKAVAKKADDVEGLKDRIEEVNEFLEEFHRENNLDEWYNEAFTRSQNQGEAFIRLFPQRDGPTKIRAIEPDFIRSPQKVGEGEGKWSWGVLTELTDTQDAKAYNIQYPSTMEESEEIVSAEFIHHFKLNVNQNVKRGLPSLYACFEELEGVQTLRQSARIGETVRSSIAYVRTHQQASEETVLAMVSAQHTGSITRHSQNGPRTVETQQIEPGSVEDVNQGLDFNDPPKSSSAESVDKSILAGLSAVAARLVLPLWLVSGENSSQSFASSLTSESPFVKRMEYLQAQNIRYWTCLLTAIVQIGIEEQVLAKDTLELMEIKITAPSVRTRNVKERVEAQKVLADAGLLSPQTWSIQNDLDYDEEQSKREEAEDTMIETPGQAAADAMAASLNNGDEDDPEREGPQTTSGEMQKSNDHPT